MLRGMPSGSPRWREIEELYHAALECDPSQQATLLARADPEVRREVASLLAQGTDDIGLSNPAPFITAALRGSERSDCPPVRLANGTRLGPYTISAQIGVGGMGEVYRATDINLARDVAIKVLPEAVASDAERLARFDREAKTLAALNHPNIAAIYGVEKSAGTTALVMELIGGPTLAERIAKGPLPIDEALLIAAQIAEALEAAHERNIIHRDLKPANIKVRRDGTVKVLDFGLAKALAPTEARSHGIPQLPTITTSLMTEAGLILGTAGYVSPEQVRGEAVDQRADIWAFGCVLYEMLTGRMAFGAGTITETMAKVLEGHADLNALPVATPPAIRRLVRRCLERSVRNRLQHIGDARADIADVRAGDPALTPVASGGGAAWHPRTVFWAAAAIALSLLTGAGAWLGASRVASEERMSAPVRFDVPRMQAAPGGPVNRSMALSPDGSHLAYVTSSSLRIRALGGDDVPLPVAGNSPFFSPDGEWLAFFSEEGLQRIPTSGGGLETITRDVGGRERDFGGSWAPDGTIILSSGGSLLRVSVEDSKTHLVASPDTAAGEVRYAWPMVLPDGRSVLFTILRKSGPAEAHIAVIDLVTGQQKTLLQGGHAARYASTGHLLYVSGGRLQAVGFDVESLDTRGVPTQVEGLEIAETVGGFHANFDVSAAGTFAYLPATPPRLRTMAWVDRDGREEPIEAAPMAYIYPRISPDGTRVALDVGGGNRDIWMWHFERQAMTRITEGPTEDLMPAWSPDGARVFFASDREGGAFRIFSVAADGGGSERPEFTGADSYMPLSMPAPNELLAFASRPGTRGGDVAVVRLGKDGHVRTLLGKEGSDGNSQVSPDGRWIAYQVIESGSAEVYVRPYPDVDQRREQISHGGGMMPLWGQAGSHELFYWTLNGTLKVVSLTLTPDLKVGPTRDVPLGDRYDTGQLGAAWSYQVSPRDGRLLLFRRVPGTGDVAPIKVVVNWFEELKRLVPTR